MTTVTITSQGQITIPAAVRRALGIDGSTELNLQFNPETRSVTIEKPLSVDEFLNFAEKFTAKIPHGTAPLEGRAIHEFYEQESVKEIVRRMEDSR